MLCEFHERRVNSKRRDEERRRERGKGRTRRPNERVDILVEVDVVLSNKRVVSESKTPKLGQSRAELTRLGTLIGIGISSVDLPTTRTRSISADMTSRTEGGAKVMAAKAIGREAAPEKGRERMK